MCDSVRVTLTLVQNKGPYSYQVCQSNWIPFNHFHIVQLRVRVANELGAGNAKGAKFATAVSVVNTLLVGFIFWLIIVAFNEKLALIFTSSSSVIQMVNELAFLLAFTILLNCIQPVLSGEYVIAMYWFWNIIDNNFWQLCSYCLYLLVFTFRGSSWMWSASSCGLYKHWKLLFGWNTSWGSPRLVSTFWHCCKCCHYLIFHSTLAQVILID